MLLVDVQCPCCGKFLVINFQSHNELIKCDWCCEVFKGTLKVETKINYKNNGGV